MEEKFNLILDQDEKIVEIFKPNKLNVFFKSIFSATLVFLLFFGSMTLGMILPDEEGVVIDLIYISIPICCFVLAEILLIVFTAIAYKNKFFCYTNKRVIIRQGVFGVDYKSLDMSMIGAMDVYVSLLDKILHKNTGTIRFGSTSSPISTQNVSSYMFNNIVDPYENYKRIKAYIDEYKESKNKEIKK